MRGRATSPCMSDRPFTLIQGVVVIGLLACTARTLRALRITPTAALREGVLPAWRASRVDPSDVLSRAFSLVGVRSGVDQSAGNSGHLLYRQEVSPSHRRSKALFSYGFLGVTLRSATGGLHVSLQVRA